jgi:hypothetical protein
MNIFLAFSSFLVFILGSVLNDFSTFFKDTGFSHQKVFKRGKGERKAKKE